MQTTNFLTKIFIHNDGTHDLIIEKTGEVVLSSRNSEWIWNERTKLEEKLREPKKCQQCRFFEYSRTIGSPNVDVWHCRYGFSPNKSCHDLAEYNKRIKEKYYREHPEELQMDLRF